MLLLSLLLVEQIGTARRAASASLCPDQVCLSLSRCLAAGLDWRQQCTVAQLQQHVQQAVVFSQQQAAQHQQQLAAAAAALTSISGHTQRMAAAKHHLEDDTTSHHLLGGQQQTATSATIAAQHAHSAASDVGSQSSVHAGVICDSSLRVQHQVQQQPTAAIDEQHMQRPQLHEQQQQQQQQHCHHIRSGCECRAWAPPSSPPRRPATTGSGLPCCSSRAAAGLPAHLAAALEHHQQLLQALHLCQVPSLHPDLDQPAAATAEPEPVPGRHNQNHHQPQQHPVVMVQQQDVQQHKSAARAAGAARLLSARRAQWVQLSSQPPPPYPVFLAEAAHDGGTCRGCGVDVCLL